MPGSAPPTGSASATIPAMICLLLSSAAYAATLDVGSASTPTLQSALDAAVSGDVIQLPAGEFEGSVDLAGRDLTVRGAGSVLGEEGSQWSSSDAFMIQAVAGESLVLEDLMLEPAGAGVLAEGGATVSLSGVHVLGGWTTGGGAQLSLVNSDLVATDCVFESGDAEGYGGSIYAWQSALDVSDSVWLTNNSDGIGGALALLESTLTATRVELAENESAENGGAVALFGSTVAFQQLTAEANVTYAGNGGAIYAAYESDLSITESVFDGNECTYGNGGALAAEYVVPISVDDTEFIDNKAYRSGGHVWLYYMDSVSRFTGTSFEGGTATYGYGGAVYAYVRAPMDVLDSTFVNNTAGYHGGAIYDYNYSNLSLERVDLIGNESRVYSGGALYLYYLWTGSTVSLNDVLISDSQAVIEGGGLFARYIDVLTLENVQLVNNSGESGLFGGGAYMQYINDLNAHDVLLADNQATYGGGLYLANTPVARWSNSIFQENTAQIGGGLCLQENEVVEFTNNTLVGNTGVKEAGTLCVFDSNGTFSNNVFAHTQAGAAAHAYDLNGAFYTEFRYNDWFGNVDGDLGGEFDAAVEWEEPGNLFDDPMLATWTANADPFDDGLVPATGSPLIDAGDPLYTDPDGSPSDIGVTGGPYAVVEDVDGDGHDTRSDCDDTDASVHPGGTETWYDGINSDCMPGSDYDQDGDGVDAPQGRGTDCDDTDPAVAEDCGEPQDTDEPTGPGPTDPGRCSTTGAGGWMLLGVLALLGRRRRS